MSSSQATGKVIGMGGEGLGVGSTFPAGSGVSLSAGGGSGSGVSFAAGGSGIGGSFSAAGGVQTVPLDMGKFGTYQTVSQENKILRNIL